MRGSIRQRGKDPKAWSLILDTGTGPDGKRKQQWNTFHGTKREAENELARLITEQNSGTSVEPNKITVGEYLQRWLRDYAAISVAGQTLRRYEGIIRGHLVPALGGHKLAKLSPLHIQTYYRKALQEGRRDKKEGGLSARTVVQHHRILREALEQAVKSRLLPNNPASMAVLPRYERKEMATLTAEQAAVLIQAADGATLHLPVVLAVTTGMRRGEILGLQWKDVDLEAGVLQVRRSLEAVREAPVFKEPKTAKGRRLVALPQLAVETLRHHRAVQAEYRLKLGPDYTDLDLVCCLPDGRPFHNNLPRDFAALLERAGLPRVRFHDLRHSHATFLLGAGVHPKIVSERLGHANISITLDTYSHVLPAMQAEAATKLDGLLEAGKRAADGVPGVVRLQTVSKPRPIGRKAGQA